MEYMSISQNQNDSFVSPGTASSLLDGGLGLARDTEDEDEDSMTETSPNAVMPFVSVDEQVLQGLIARIVEQDQSAFTALFKAFSGRVHSLALRITGNVQLAEEATEDAFFQIWRQAPRFDPDRGTAKTWILTIARSRALDARRSIPPFVELPDSINAENVGEQNHADLPDLLSAIDQNDRLHEALESLDFLPRQLIALAFFKGLSHEEIANHAGLPLGTVKSHLRRAIIYLRAALTAPTSMMTNEQ